METEASLVWSYGAVELYTVSGVGLDLSAVVNPSDAEGEYTVWLDHSLHYLSFFKFRMLVVDILNGFQHFLDGLQVLTLSRVLGTQLGHQFCGFHK